ncbi:MAG: HEAT repeat domain-containing protein [Deltaproteobacteria bacterium]|nr:HEAT repeat domain-containing protein [Deltaproteobacteria bacterium]
MLIKSIVIYISLCFTDLFFCAPVTAFANESTEFEKSRSIKEYNIKTDEFVNREETSSQLADRLWAELLAATDDEMLQTAIEQISPLSLKDFMTWAAIVQQNFASLPQKHHLKVLRLIRNKITHDEFALWILNLNYVGCSEDLLQIINSLDSSEKVTPEEIYNKYANKWMDCAKENDALRLPTATFLLRYTPDNVDQYPNEWFSALEAWNTKNPQPPFAHILVIADSPNATTAIAPLLNTNPVLYLSLRLLKNDAARLLAEQAFTNPTYNDEQLTEDNTDTKIDDDITIKSKKYAAQAIEAIGFIESCPIVLQALKNEKHFEVQRYLLLALSRLKCSGGIAQIFPLIDTTELKLQAAAVIALGSYPDLTNIPRLIYFLNSTNTEISQAAAASLMQQPIVSNHESRPLIKLAKTTQDDFIRAKLISYLAKYRTTTMAKLLFPIIKKANDDETLLSALLAYDTDFNILSKQRIRTLASIGNLDSRQNCLENESCQQLIIEAALALARIGDTKANNILWDSLQFANDRQTKEALAVALVQLKDKRINKFLSAWENDENRRTKIRATAQLIIANSFSKFSSNSNATNEQQRELLNREINRFANTQNLIPKNKQLLSNIDNTKLQYRVIGAGSKYANLKVNINTKVLPHDSKIHISLFGLNGHHRYLVDYMAYELQIGENIIQHPLNDLLFFELRRPLELQIAIGDEFYNAHIEPLGDWVEIAMNDGINPLPENEARLICGDRIAYGHTDIAGTILFEGVAPGMCSVDFLND